MLLRVSTALITSWKTCEVDEWWWRIISSSTPNCLQHKKLKYQVDIINSTNRRANTNRCAGQIQYTYSSLLSFSLFETMDWYKLGQILNELCRSFHQVLPDMVWWWLSWIANANATPQCRPTPPAILLAAQFSQLCLQLVWDLWKQAA